jgi:hypothetical protein
MTAYDVGFGLALLLLFGTEFVALARNHGETLTSKTITWMKRKRTWWRRLMVGVFIVWLFWHFVFQYFN